MFTHFLQRSQHRFWAFYVISFASLLLSVGCGGSSCQPAFPSGAKIDKTRILAIKSEPAEATPGKPVVFSFLAMTPEGFFKAETFLKFPKCLPSKDAGASDAGDAGGFPAPSAFWTACIPKSGLSSGQADNACARAPVGGGGGGRGEVPRDGGTQGADGGSKDSAVNIQIMFPPCGATATWLPQSNSLDGLSEGEKYYGKSALVTLITTFKKHRQISLKHVRVSAKPDEQKNQNPRLIGASVNDTEVPFCRQFNISDCKVIEIPVNKKARLRFVIDSKTQDLLPPNKDGERFPEDITLQYYTTQGEFQPGRTIWSGLGRDKDSIWPDWSPLNYKGEPLKEGTEFWIAVVARDKEGGTDWIVLRFRLGASVPSPKD